MDFFNYKENELYAEDVSLKEIAEKFDTPTFVYSKATIARHYAIMQSAIGQDHLVCFAVKANSNLSLLKLLADLGSGFDIVSVGELKRVLAAGGQPNKIVFSGVGKQDHELKAALEAKIHCFNVESEDELFRLSALARSMRVQAPVALRVNPDVDPKSHPYISTGLKANKFGIPMNQALTLYLEAQQLPGIQVKGIASHIGSQILELSPFVEAAKKLTEFYQTLKANKVEVEHIDLGGGLGVPYTKETPPTPKAWLDAMVAQMPSACPKIIIEPGRAVMANAGILLTKVICLKQTEQKTFAVVDCGMNDYIRPALYNADHDIWPVKRLDGPRQQYDIVGPICETGDFLGKEKELPNLTSADLLCIRGCGAYGFAMSSNYNSRARAAEVLVDGASHQCIRPREDLEELMAHEMKMISDLDTARHHHG